MEITKKICLLLVVASTPLLARGNSLTLLNELDSAQVGDYLVTTRARNFTVLLIRAKPHGNLLLEEITAPQAVGKAQKGKWKQWLLHSAPGHSSWTTMLIDGSTGKVVKSYSYSASGWVDRSDPFFTTMLTLEFRPLKHSDRRKVGPAPQTARDNRSVWHPPLIFEGRQVNVPFDAFAADWPKDGSELAGRQITIYLPQCSQDYPCHFPYWVEAHALVGDNKIRVVDSGRSLQSPQPEIEALLSHK